MNNIYLAICGSRSLGTELPDSDYDIVCSESVYENNTGIEHSHVYTHESKELFIRKLILMSSCVYNIMNLYPFEYLEENDLSKYIQENNERIVRDNLKNLYNISYAYAMGITKALIRNPNNINSKRAARSAVYFNFLYRYATEDIPFGEALKPSGEFKDYIMGVRRKEIAISDVVSRNTDLQSKAESVSDFYNSMNIDGINKSISDLNSLMGANQKLIEVRE